MALRQGALLPGVALLGLLDGVRCAQAAQLALLPEFECGALCGLAREHLLALELTLLIRVSVLVPAGLAGMRLGAPAAHRLTKRVRQTHCVWSPPSG